jgi:APA family basic amino acid/polyamine antiporter
VLYILFSYVLTGIASYKEFMAAGSEASVSYAITHHMPGFGWLSLFITIAILAGFSSVILVMLLGQTRIFYTMSRDGLVPSVFSDVHPKHRTPFKSQWVFFVFVSLFAAFIPDNVVGDMTSIGTLFAFVLVCIGILIIRNKKMANAPFKTPAVWIVAPLGALICLAMIAGLGLENWARLIVWLLIGFIIYFGYSRKHSKVRHGEAVPSKDPEMPKEPFER